MDHSSIPKRAAGYAIAEFEGEHMIFHPVDGRAVYLSESASLIWQLCDGQRSVADITVLLQAAYPDAGDVQADVAAALATFVEQRVVEMP
jgi:coenzyme PQQ biosynthesis protein PqqD